MTGLGTLPRSPARTPGMGVLCLLIATGTASALPQGLPQVGRAEFPDDDAVILRQQQAWTLGDDGTVVYEEHRFVKLLSDRAWRRYADPRVDYLEGAEQVELLAARTHLPDGTVLDIPEYSSVVVSPSRIYRWPVMARWRQAVFIFSGVQNDAVLELHYKRTSKPGTRRWLSADLRIGDLDPVVERVIEVTVPSAPDALRFDWSPKRAGEFKVLGEKGQQTTYRWTLRDIAAAPDEPHCPPWRQRCGRLWFTNCPSAKDWVADIQRAVESAAEEDDAIRKFVVEATKDQLDEAGKVRAVAKKLRDTFNFVNDSRGWSGRRLRPAGEVFDSSHGSRLESAALMLAMLQSLGLQAEPRVAVNRQTFAPNVPTDSDLIAVVIEVALPSGTLWLEPSSGIVNPNRDWPYRDLLFVKNGELQQFAAFASVSSQPPSARVRGQVKLDDEAEKLTGELNIELTGLFVNPQKLRSDKQSRSRIEAVVSQVLPLLKVTDFTVTHLSESRFVARATVESKEGSQDVYGRRLIALAADTPALAEADLPLERSNRRTAIQLPGILSGDLQLDIELPEGWQPVILPEPLREVVGDWGRLTQAVEVIENKVRIRRQVSFSVRTIEPGDFATVRQAVRTLRSDACRTLLIEDTRTDARASLPRRSCSGRVAVSWVPAQ